MLFRSQKTYVPLTKYVMLLLQKYFVKCFTLQEAADRPINVRVPLLGRMGFFAENLRSVMVLKCTQMLMF